MASDGASSVLPALSLRDLSRATLARQRTAMLTVRPFDRLARADRRELATEGEALLRFVEPDTDHDVRVVDP